jgi:hypothetical protein
MTTPRTSLIVWSLGLALLAGCANPPTIEPPGEYVWDKRQRDAIRYGRLFSSEADGGFLLSGRGNDREAEGGAGGIGVNGFLWRASLETLDFLPLVSADPFGGTIITDWYAPPEAPDERFKITAYILGRELRADGLRVSVFRQVRADDAWIDAPVDAQTATAIEDRILTRAREEVGG